MKLLFATVQIPTFLLWALFPTASANNPLECLATAPPAGQDLFPSKVTPTSSQGWSVEYFDTYKIVTNKLANNERYLLFQCGTNPPVSLPNITQTIQIPVQFVGIDQTPSIPFLEHLDVVDRIVAFTSSVDYISSACLLEKIANGTVLTVQNPQEYDSFVVNPSHSQTSIARLLNSIGFVSPYSENSPFDVNVKVSATSETTNAGVFEWIKYYSAFFNLETVANEVFEQTQSRWQKVTAVAQSVQDDSTINAPVVLWAYWSDYCDGWDVAECPNYYCEYAEQCGTRLLNSTEGVFSEKCGAKYMTTTQFVEFARSADYWMYPSPNWDDAYTQFRTELNRFKSVQNQHVYDYQASGPNAWFEQRFPEYFAVLQDFCSVTGKTTAVADRSWFRNTLDGSSPIGSQGVCTEMSRANSILECDQDPACDTLAVAPPRPALTFAPTAAPTDASSGWRMFANVSGWMILMVVVLLLVGSV